MKVYWTENAVKDLENIRDYISKYDPDAAKRIVTKIYNVVQELGEFPFSGKQYLLKNDKNLREKIVFDKYRIAHCSRLIDI